MSSFKVHKDENCIMFPKPGVDLSSVVTYGFKDKNIRSRHKVNGTG